MQEEDGSMTGIEMPKFHRMLRKAMLNKDGSIPNEAKVVRVGDRFKIRGCKFEITKITPDGIEAKGVAEVEWNPEENSVIESLGGTTKVGRNQPCICGSGRKYKNCCSL